MAFHVPIYQQDKGYSALEDRMAWSGAVQAGVVQFDDFIPFPVTVSGQGYLRVTGGYAWVPGTQTTNQGYYGVWGDHVSQDVPIAAADAAQPRLDNLILRVYDPNSDAGSGPAGPAARAELVYQAGVPQAGASLTNVSTAPTLPANSLLLYHNFMPAGAGTITNVNNLMERRTFSKGQFKHVERVAGAVNGVAGAATDYVITTSAPSGPIDSTNLVLRIESNGSNYYRAKFKAVGWSVDLFNVPTGYVRQLTIGFDQDGSGIGWCYTNLQYAPPNGNEKYYTPIYAERIWKPTAGTHVIRPIYSTLTTGAGVVTITADPSNPAEFSVEEIVKPVTIT